MTCRVGFTGSRKGMSDDTLIRVTLLMRRLVVTEAHHGDCIGCDAQFHDIAKSLRIPITIHPPEISTLRAYCEGGEITVLPERRYHERNHDIVHSVDIMIACPKGPEITRSGTWGTIRFARKAKHIKCIYIFMPDGLDDLMEERFNV